MEVLAINGRNARFYKAGDFYLPVTYHKVIKGKIRQLTISDKLLRKVLRQTEG